MSTNEIINVGKITGVFGLKGWLKIFSHTQPRENILGYTQWFVKKGIKEQSVKVIGGQLQGKYVVAQLEGVSNRDEAENFMGWDIYIAHEQLPPLAKGQYYWTDLVGLEVENLEGYQLGKVESLFETGANDILLVKGDRERAVPFLQGNTVKSVDLGAGKIIVDWDPDF
ncbi:MAG: ribosome maturation factor RimM [Methyloglobulus sp.]|nr:ribosome maturation factor RimM [Methyloglobulus sp.]